MLKATSYPRYAGAYSAIYLAIEDDHPGFDVGTYCDIATVCGLSPISISSRSPGSKRVGIQCLFGGSTYCFVDGSSFAPHTQSVLCAVQGDQSHRSAARGKN
jgi:hypothetical protein